MPEREVETAPDAWTNDGLKLCYGGKWRGKRKCESWGKPNAIPAYQGRQWAMLAADRGPVPV